MFYKGNRIDHYQVQIKALNKNKNKCRFEQATI